MIFNRLFLPRLVMAAALIAALMVVSCQKDDSLDSSDGPESEEPAAEPELKPLTGTTIGDNKTWTGTTIGDNKTWTGLDLGNAHIISRVGFKPHYGQGALVELGLFEGANEPSFYDALPLAIVKKKGTTGKMDYIDINCSKGFRYVRYVASPGTNSVISALEVYGTPGEGDNSKLVQLTNLPTVVINTENAAAITSKEVYVNSNVSIISDGGTTALLTTDTGVRGRGNASWSFPKKPYRIKFDKKQSPLGAPASAKSWTLINNYGDKTLMRNILAFEVSRRVGMAYTPFCTPVDVILNGEYQGCYQLCDQVEVGDGRVPAKKGYLIEIDAYAWEEESYFVSNNDMPVTIKYPKDDEITPEQHNFIEDCFNKMEAQCEPAVGLTSTIIGLISSPNSFFIISMISLTSSMSFAWPTTISCSLKSSCNSLM